MRGQRASGNWVPVLTALMIFAVGCFNSGFANAQGSVSQTSTVHESSWSVRCPSDQNLMQSPSEQGGSCGHQQPWSCDLSWCSGSSFLIPLREVETLGGGLDQQVLPSIESTSGQTASGPFRPPRFV